MQFVIIIQQITPQKVHCLLKAEILNNLTSPSRGVSQLPAAYGQPQTKHTPGMLEDVFCGFDVFYRYQDPWQKKIIIWPIC